MFRQLMYAVQFTQLSQSKSSRDPIIFAGCAQHTPRQRLQTQETRKIFP
jgi:hypothetical protein